ncbi:MAG: HIT domain-containing protein [Candidatus Yanofskybacteria bacterium]|nr:HIT domain-containing protein [Candidatus Yanofskybacteria bacterium]
MLVIPKRHVLCIGAMEEDELEVLSGLLYAKVQFAFKNEYPGYWNLMFEHGIVGQTIQHAHIHILPGEFHLSSRIGRDFPKESFPRSFLNMPTPFKDLGGLYREKQKPYLLWQDESTPWCQPTVCWDPSAPPQYLRTVTAEALGRPERGNWRQMDPELDKKLGQETVRRLKPYFS